MTESVKRTLPWRIIAALVVAGLLAVGGWVFAQDKPAAPVAPAAAPAPTPSKPDPAGTATGGIADVTAKEAGKPTLAEVADFAGPATLVHAMGLSTPKAPAMAMSPERAR